MNNFYCVTYEIHQVFKVSDEEMRKNGYEDADEITEEMRREYLDSLINEYNSYDDLMYDDIEIKKMILTKEEEKEVLERGAYDNA